MAPIWRAGISGHENRLGGPGMPTADFCDLCMANCQISERFIGCADLGRNVRCAICNLFDVIDHQHGNRALHASRFSPSLELLARLLVVVSIGVNDA